MFSPHGKYEKTEMNSAEQ